MRIRAGIGLEKKVNEGNIDTAPWRERIKAQKKSIARNFLYWAAISYIMNWLFYDMWTTFFLFILLFPLFYKYRYRNEIKKRQYELKYEFIDGMVSVYSSLASGNSIENSFRNALADLQAFGGRHQLIQNEFEILCRSLDKNIPFDRGLNEMAKRCGDDDIQQFAEVMILARHSGGNVIQMIRDSIERIQRRMETGFEIEAMISAKKSEFYMMCLIPGGIILYMKIFSAEFMSVLYHNTAGIVFMSACLLIYVLCLAFGKKLLDINV